MIGDRGTEKTPANGPACDGPRIKISANGPYLVSGAVPLMEQTIVPDANGDGCAWREGGKIPTRDKYSLCRCGRSGKKPFCDGAHVRAGFDGAETAGRARYLEQAEKTEGPELDLTDAEALCAGARFCSPSGGTWELVERSDDPGAKKLAVQQAADCPAGRLVAWDKKGNALEPALEPGIGLVEDPHEGVSGPLWVRGGIPVESADGSRYEVRNRVTLCRCGRSRNKPFCDGAHLDKPGESG